MADLKVILCGQRAFGTAVYYMLRELPDVEIVAVYAPEGDKLAGQAAIRETPLRLSGTLRSDTMPAADLLIAAHSHDFVSRPVRRKLRIGAVGYHPSLLPLHRGRDAVRWTIRMRDRIAGGTVFWLTDTVDSGPIAAQDWCWVQPDDDAHTLWRRDLFPLGVRLLRQTVEDVKHGNLVMRDQPENLSTWEPALTGQPLYRPELPMIGTLLAGLRIIK